MPREPRHSPPCEPTGRVTVPVHAGVILKPKTLLSILEQAGVSVEEFVNLL